MTDFMDFWMFEQCFPGSGTGEVKGVCEECGIEWTEEFQDLEYLECPECGALVEPQSTI